MASTLFREPGWTSPLSQNKPKKVVWTPRPNRKKKADGATATSGTASKKAIPAQVKTREQMEEELLCQIVREFVSSRLAEIEQRIALFSELSEEHMLLRHEMHALQAPGFARLLSGSVMTVGESVVRSFREFSSKARKLIRRQKALATSLRNVRFSSSGVPYFRAAGTASAWVSLLDYVNKSRSGKRPHDAS